MEYSSKGITIAMSDTKEGKYKKLYGLYQIPDIGADPEAIDVTNFDDHHKRSVKGVGDFGNLQFDFYYNKEEKEDDEGAEKLLNTYKALKAAEAEDEPKWWKLTYPDGSTQIWQGDASVKRVSAGINDPLKFRLTTTVRTEIEESA